MGGMSDDNRTGLRFGGERLSCFLLNGVDSLKAKLHGVFRCCPPPSPEYVTQGLSHNSENVFGVGEDFFASVKL